MSHKNNPKNCKNFYNSPPPQRATFYFMISFGLSSSEKKSEKEIIQKQRLMSDRNVIRKIRNMKKKGKSIRN